MNKPTNDLAAKVARAIFEIGDSYTPCQRIVFMGGEYPDNEIRNGGLCEESLADNLHAILTKLNITEARVNERKV